MLLLTSSTLAAPCDGLVAKELRECLRVNYAFTPAVEAACAGQEEGYYRWRCRQEKYAVRGVVINPPILHKGPPTGVPTPAPAASTPASTSGTTPGWSARDLELALTPASPAAVLATRLPKSDFPDELLLPAEPGITPEDLGRYYTLDLTSYHTKGPSNPKFMATKVPLSGQNILIDTTKTESGVVTNKIEAEAGAKYMGLGASAGGKTVSTQKYVRAFWLDRIHRLPPEAVAALPPEGHEPGAIYYVAEIQTGGLYEKRCTADGNSVEGGLSFGVVSTGGGSSGTNAECNTVTTALQVNPGADLARATSAFGETFTTKTAVPIFVKLRRLPDQALMKSLARQKSMAYFIPLIAWGPQPFTLTASIMKVGTGTRELWRSTSDSDGLLGLTSYPPADDAVVGLARGSLTFSSSTGDTIVVMSPMNQTHRTITAKQLAMEVGVPDAATGIQAGFDQMAAAMPNPPEGFDSGIVTLDAGQLSLVGFYVEGLDEE